MLAFGPSRTSVFTLSVGKIDSFLYLYSFIYIYICYIYTFSLGRERFDSKYFSFQTFSFPQVASWGLELF